MVRAGEDVAHQLPRDTGSCPCNPDLSEGRTRISELLQMDNTTAVAYVNNLGETVFPQLTTLAKTLWIWALQRDILLTAQHIPGVSNIVADTESRTVRDRTDWKLSPAIFSQIYQIFGPL